MTKLKKVLIATLIFIVTILLNLNVKAIDLNLFNIYKLNNSLIPFKNIELAIKNYIIKREYNKLNDKTIDYENFYKENENLIKYDEIVNIKEEIINKYPVSIGKILNCSSIKFVPSKPKNITSEYIICKDKDLQNLFFEISLKLVD